MPHIESVMSEGAQIKLAIVGIGNPYRMSTMERFGYLDETLLQQLKQLGTAADINSRFIDREGRIVNHPINRRVIGMELEQLRQVEQVVGLAFGMHKIESILAALRGGWIHMLVTDETTAVQLVEETALHKKR
nr:sugar-binding domain-containing protein [Paenibacillus protaetiae]